LSARIGLRPRFQHFSFLPLGSYPAAFGVRERRSVPPKLTSRLAKPKAAC
jgi:hypothetical protein